ncbi:MULTISPECIES: hypothetical protein [Streptomyces]|uniref:Uncharacterized protein n=1 Tax=Streptomyces virginiae TaxID=1961 RepID=A0ABQ3NQ60_STRVG|nr:MULTISPECIES: hypothetical protein [Streptomyces]MBP2341219.1 hypothetical protein [Streptomyces virginiae]MCI4078958.1 hypothetical protein [Streptomyces sp. MMS21 TC-5]QNE23426.1 hypothetical protein F1D59_00310 [Streptomyces sp. INR7]QNE29746.1 hypothetical protein F1D59_37530 [Streptomyces sp. INR7]RST08035.1 hypothetical protein EF904_16780 [Streptomyces sp. WAC05950]
MRTTIGYTVESIGYVIAAQGLVGFASQTFFGTEWGWLHKLVDLPPAAHLAVLAAGLALVAAGVRTRKTPRHRQAA